jgi:hypothetical protein
MALHLNTSAQTRVVSVVTLVNGKGVHIVRPDGLGGMEWLAFTIIMLQLSLALTPTKNYVST